MNYRQVPRLHVLDLFFLGCINIVFYYNMFLLTIYLKSCDRVLLSICFFYILIPIITVLPNNGMEINNQSM